MRPWITASIRSARLPVPVLSLLLVSALAWRLPAASPAADPPPARAAATAPIAVLQHEMETGRWTSEELVSHFLAEITRQDGELRAVLALNPGAIEDARRLDNERRAGTVRGPLHGIPILVKDNIETRELPTTAGSLALAHNHTGRDAPVIARLRQAGVVILGKTNLSEWANFRSVRSSSGWSAVGGQTRNVHDPSRTPCGSSSGSGVAVAAGLCVAALGTETDGSIVCPSTVSGITGLKPTVGRVSRTGIVPISHSQDTAGPMTRCVADAALLLQVMQGPDPLDAATLAACPVGAGQPEMLSPAALKGLRLGVLRSGTGYHEGVEACFTRSLDRLRAAGVVLVDSLELVPPAGFDADCYTVLLHEFKAGINACLKDLDPALPAHDLAGLIRFNLDHSTDELGWFGQEIFLLAEATTGLDAPEYTAALQRIRRATREAGLERLFVDHRIDALLTPTGGPAWSIDLVTGDHFLGGSSTYPAVAGTPHLTLPMGTVHGLPVGLSLLGPECEDLRLLELGAALEPILTEIP